MELNTLYTSWFTQNFLVCKYSGRIDTIQSKIIDECHTEISMHIVMENTKKDIPVKFTYANTNLCRTKEDLNNSFRIKFDKDNLPISGKTLITEKGGPAILNFDTGIKNRITSELISNGVESSYINVPYCKGTVVQEYGIGVLIGIGIEIILFIMILYISIKKCCEKPKLKK